MTLILIGISLVFAVIFYKGSKEPTGKLVNRRAEDFVVLRVEMFNLNIND